MPFCSYCGHSLEPDGAFCPSCGRRAATGTVSGPTPPSPGSPGYYGQSSPTFEEADQKALGRLWFASLIFLGTFVIGYGSLIFLNPFASFAHVIPIPSGAVPDIFTGTFLTYLIVLSIVGAVVEILAVLLIYFSFRNLQSVDRSHFHLPSILTLLYLVALPVVFVGAGIELAGIPGVLSSFSQQQTTTPPTFVASGFGTLLAGAGIELLGGLIALVGFIGGIMLGLWRVGERYDNTLIKISAILVIIPVLDVAVPILMLIGIWQTRSRIFPAMSSNPPV